jgi:thioredoxin-like negative regulator of GroEL
MLAKTLEDVKTQIPIEVIDIDENQQIAMDYGIRGVPTLVMIDGDIEVKRFSGMKMKNEIETWLGA